MFWAFIAYYCCDIDQSKDIDVMTNVNLNVKALHIDCKALSK